jgi:hypothetical protein
MAVHQGNRHKLELGDPIAHIHSGVPGRRSTDVLRTFIRCGFGSFTKAARLFGLTQPAISAQVRKLEAWSDEPDLAGRSRHQPYRARN